MQQILIVEASPRGVASASRAVTDALVTRLAGLHPSAKIVRRDLAGEPLPHLDRLTLQAISTRSLAEADAPPPEARLSDRLTEELLASDLLVIATPMWNFGVPSTLKAWIDLVVRPGRTFRYAEGGVEGLARGKRAILVIASGGIFTEGPWAAWDFVEPYLRRILGFIGVVEVQTIRVEGTNLPQRALDVVSNAGRAVERLAL